MGYGSAERRKLMRSLVRVFRIDRVRNEEVRMGTGIERKLSSIVQIREY